MRLNSDQVQAIKQAAQQVLGDDARVTLFGSRTNDALRGGDIDLMFETPHQLVDRVAATGQLYVTLIRHLGDRKIDVLLKDAATDEAPVMRVARETGVVL
jgi:predicted nucleotidyltransferase